MTTTGQTGYSDRINHALAFAAKHHDREVRKGTRLPYFTAPAHVAIILTRYGCDEETVVAGILQHVVDDALRDGTSPEAVRERLADKFGDATVDVLLAGARRRLDDDGVELSHEEQKLDQLERLATAPDGARWVFAAHELHAAGTLLADLGRTSFPDAVWGRVPEGRAARVRWLERVSERLQAIGFHGAVADELQATGAAIAELARALA
jgi:(p)ppGpp synthase/HD superfamily hydrolase